MVSSRRFRNASEDLEEKIRKQNQEKARDTTLALECETPFMSADKTGAHLKGGKCKVIVEEPYNDNKTIELPELNRMEVEADKSNLIT